MITAKTHMEIEQSETEGENPMVKKLVVLLACMAVLGGCSKGKAERGDKAEYTITHTEIDSRDTADMLGLHIYKFQLGVPAGWYYVMMWVDSESGETGESQRRYLSQIVYELHGNDYLRVMLPSPGKEGISFSIGQTTGHGQDRMFLPALKSGDGYSMGAEWMPGRTMTFSFGEEVTLVDGYAMGGSPARDRASLKIRLDKATKDSPGRYSWGQGGPSADANNQGIISRRGHRSPFR